MRGLLAGLPALLLGVGCIYLDDPNYAPTLTLTADASGPVYRGTPITVHAVPADRNAADLAGLKITWAMVDPTGAPLNLTAYDDCVADRGSWCFVPHRLDLTYRVLATVTDAHGAALSAFLDFTTQDRPPTAGIDVRGTTWDDGNYRLLSPVTLSPLPSKDPDAEDLCDLAYQFAFVDLPVASNPTLAECGTDYRTGCTAPVPTTCFTPDVAGSYQVQLTVTDSAGATATATAFVIVDPDQPPCLRQLTPQPEGTIVVSRSDLSVTLAANVVEDDLDPYPLGATNLPGFPRFAWSIQLPGDVAPVAVADYDRNAYTLDLDAFSIGDTIGARVEVADRTPRSSCASADDGCPVGVDPLTGCVQRVTWTLEVR